MTRIALRRGLAVLVIFLTVPVFLVVAMLQGQETSNSLLLSTIEQMQEDFQNVPCRQKDRSAGVKALFDKVGAPVNSLSIEKLEGVENLVLRQTGTSDETVVIGAHYDFAERGCGAVDNWTGIVALAHLYRTIRMLPVHKRVLFVAFGKEELGLVGSKAMVKAIPTDEVSKYCAMINIDSFGLAKPFALENASSPRLMDLAKTAAEKLGIPFYTVAVNNADADSSSFKAREIPAVTLSGLSNEWQSILHSTNDQPAKVIPASVYLGYRLALTMWSTIDAAPCAAYRTELQRRPSLQR